MEALFELLFKYRPTLFERGSVVLGVPWPVLVGLIVLAVLLTPTLLRYTRARGRTDARDRLVLIGLRGGLLAILVFCLCRPALVLSTAVPQQSFVGILVDDSLSMRIADAGGHPRSEFVRAALADPRTPLRKALEARFKLRYLRFADRTERVTGLDQLEFGGEGTDLAAALDRARQELSSAPLAGLVVVSDGADTKGGALTEALVALRASGVPVSVVGVGRERFDRDLEVTRVEAPREVLENTTLAADVHLTHRGLAGQRVQLVVEDGGRVVHTEPVELPVVGELSVRVHATASDPGPRVFSFRVVPLPGEQVVENNRRDVLIRVADREEKILYFEGEPRFEAKFLRRAVEADHNLRVVTLLRTSENKFYRVGVDDAEELADGFPKTREELYRYRGLILGSIEASFFTPDQLRMIGEFVSERGGGLLMLGGRHSFSEGGYARTPVADALPVVLEERPAQAGPARAEAVLRQCRCRADALRAYQQRDAARRDGSRVGRALEGAACALHREPARARQARGGHAADRRGGRPGRTASGARLSALWRRQGARVHGPGLLAVADERRDPARRPDPRGALAADAALARQRRAGAGAGDAGRGPRQPRALGGAARGGAGRGVRAAQRRPASSQW